VVHCGLGHGVVLLLPSTRASPLGRASAPIVCRTALSICEATLLVDLAVSDPVQLVQDRSFQHLLFHIDLNFEVTNGSHKNLMVWMTTEKTLFLSCCSVKKGDDFRDNPGV